MVINTIEIQVVAYHSLFSVLNSNRVKFRICYLYNEGHEPLQYAEYPDRVQFLEEDPLRR